eukprot:Clim_evm43s229 gene=Clim_evmTU43s229
MPGRHITYEECIHDRPGFREAVIACEADVKAFGKYLQNVQDKSIKARAALAAYHKSMNDLSDTIQGVSELGIYAGEKEAASVGRAFAVYVNDCNMHSEMLSTQMNFTLEQFLSQLQHNVVTGGKQLRKDYHHALDAYDNALAKMNGISAAKGKPQDFEQAQANLEGARFVHRHSAIDYVDFLNMTRDLIRYEAQQQILDYLGSEQIYHSACIESCRQLAKTQERLSLVIAAAKEKATAGLKDRENRHQWLDENYLAEHSAPPKDWAMRVHDAQFGGHLFRRKTPSSSSWTKGFYIVKDGRMFQLVGGQFDDEQSWEVVADEVADLRLCTVKPSQADRRCCFDLITTHSAITFQAASQEEVNDWMSALNAGIANALNSGVADVAQVDDASNAFGQDMRDAHKYTNVAYNIRQYYPEAGDLIGGEAALQRVSEVDGNKKCIDCGAEDPEWVSINMGCLVCLECSGVHRSLGVHVSKVRSLRLDQWEPELVDMLCRLGNASLNELLDPGCNGFPDVDRPVPTSPRTERERYIKAKYINQLGVPDSDLGDSDKIAALMETAIEKDDLVQCLKAMLLGCSPQGHTVKDHEPYINEAVRTGSPELIELLYQGGADVNAADEKGHNALMECVVDHKVQHACVLLKKGADSTKRNQEGEDALDLALREEQVDIVTLIKLSRLATEAAADA